MFKLKQYLITTRRIEICLFKSLKETERITFIIQKGFKQAVRSFGLDTHYMRTKSWSRAQALQINSNSNQTDRTWYKCKSTFKAYSPSHSLRWILSILPQLFLLVLHYTYCLSLLYFCNHHNRRLGSMNIVTAVLKKITVFVRSFFFFFFWIIFFLVFCWIFIFMFRIAT